MSRMLNRTIKAELTTNALLAFKPMLGTVLFWKSNFLLKNKYKMQEFNLEHQYQLYLQRMALSESTMHQQQKIQLRQTFFGASGQMLILLRDELSKLDEEKAMETLQDLINQVGNFFLAETNKMN